MGTLDELIHYCNESDPVGALMLTGEWGCGKTHLIKRNLTKALEDSHVIIRISLFGMSSAGTLHKIIRQKWLDAYMPALGSLQKAKDKGFFSAVSSTLKKINPLAGGAADVIVSMNMLDLITIKPEIEDLKTHKKKKVILVYDDLERIKMDVSELLGVINNYCENQGFNTIILANEEYLKAGYEHDRINYHLLKEKTVSQTILHIPDYSAVIHAIVSKERWQTPEYAEYLLEHEDVIRDAFMSDSDKPKRSYLTDQDRKYHNFRSLTKGLQSFYRIYYHFNEVGADVPDSRLYSFLAYYCAKVSGICRGGKLELECTDEDIKEFYPKYSPDDLTEAERYWISTGVWDKEGFVEELAASGVLAE